MYLEQSIITILAVINLVAFLIMGYDKSISANHNARRIPEKTLFIFALAFGATGIYLGMLAFRHKTRKWYFQLAIPLLALGNLATFYFLKEMLIA